MVSRPYSSSVTSNLQIKLYIIEQYLMLIIWLQLYARSDWLLSGHYFLVMTGHYEIFFFSVKFALDLGVIKKKLSHFQRNCFYCPFWFRSHGQGYLCSVNMTSNDLLHAQTDIGERFRFFFPALKRLYNINNLLHQGLGLSFPCNDLTLGY